MQGPVPTSIGSVLHGRTLVIVVGVCGRHLATGQGSVVEEETMKPG